MNAKDKAGIINIHGKEYQTVAYRVSNFRAGYPEWTLKTTILFRDEKCVVMQAEIMDKEGRLIANGHAEEFRSSSSINKTSALENAETSAIGRALAALGIGGTEFASADELVNAITKKQPASKSDAIVALATEKGVTPTAGALENFNEEQRRFIQEFAEGIQVHFDSGTDHGELVKMLEERHLDPEEKIAVWSFLDSKCRSAIKKAKANHTPAEMAAQA